MKNFKHKSIQSTVLPKEHATPSRIVSPEETMIGYDKVDWPKIQQIAEIKREELKTEKL